LIFKKCKHAAPLDRISKTSNIQRDDFTYLFVGHHFSKKDKNITIQNRLSRNEYEDKKYAQKCETLNTKQLSPNWVLTFLSSPTVSLLSKLMKKKKTETI